MKEILAAVGLAEHSAEEIDIHGQRAILVYLQGEGPDVWRAARAGLAKHYPVLVFNTESVVEPEMRHQLPPAEILERAAALDLDAEIGRLVGKAEDWMLGSRDDEYSLQGVRRGTGGSRSRSASRPARDRRSAAVRTTH